MDLRQDITKALKPPHLEVLPDATDAARIFHHWPFSLERIRLIIVVISEQTDVLCEQRFTRSF